MPSQAQSRIGAFGGSGSSGTLWLRPRGQAEAKLKDEEKRMARRLESQVRLRNVRLTRDWQRTTCSVQPTMQRATSHAACSTRQPTVDDAHDATHASLQIAQIEAKRDEEAALPIRKPAPDVCGPSQSRADVDLDGAPPPHRRSCAAPASAEESTARPIASHHSAGAARAIP